jgi:hypothetical protein
MNKADYAIALEQAIRTEEIGLSARNGAKRHERSFGLTTQSGER